MLFISILNIILLIITIIIIMMFGYSRYPAVGTSTKRSLGERVRDYTGARKVIIIVIIVIIAIIAFIITIIVRVVIIIVRF